MKRRVLILGTGNSAPAQMAEGLLSLLAGEDYEVVSAGSESPSAHPLAVLAMRERGIDITRQHARPLREVLGQPFDVVITLSNQAMRAVPPLPGQAERLHWHLPDLEAAQGWPQRLAAFRHARNELETRLRTWLRAEAAGLRPAA